MRIVGLVGPRGSGKDTVATMLKSLFPALQVFAFADPVRAVCTELFLLQPDQLRDRVLKETKDPRWDLSPRQMMQRVGTDLVRQHLDVDQWLRLMQVRLEAARAAGCAIAVLSDVRFANEAALCSSLIRIDRCSTGSARDHVSETEQMGIECDITINNRGSMQQLRAQVERLLL